jgi:hypothetical protein
MVPTPRTPRSRLAPSQVVACRLAIAMVASGTMSGVAHTVGGDDACQCRATATSARGTCGTPRVTIIITPRVFVSPHDLSRAGKVVQQVFAAAHIDVEWLLAGPQSASIAPERNMRRAGPTIPVVVLPTGGSSSPEHITLGDAALDTAPAEWPHRAPVVLYYRRIQQAARMYQKPVALMLALITTHEVGHIILQTAVHAQRGIMKAPWDHLDLERAEHDDLGFAAVEAELLGQTLQPCAR